MTYKRRAPWSSSGNGPAYKRKRKTTIVRGRRTSPSVATEVRRVLNGRTGGYVGLERKFFDTFENSRALQASTNASSGEMDPFGENCLNCPAQGDGESNRDGRQIAMQSITLKGNITVPYATTPTTQWEAPVVYVAIVLDKQTNGATLNSEDVFANPSGDARGMTQPLRNLEYSDRFTVLKSTTVNMKDVLAGFQIGGTPTGQAGMSIPFYLYHDLKGMKMNFISGQNTSVIAAVADKSLHVIAYTTTASLGPVITYNARLRFTG